ncbi:MAG TPA: sugar phosphate isomerase/epimerase [Acidobacteriota bacterium]|jgi:sugar phosphate isomerase/epimerase|nr:sugar phosphate isomerase/epimerase [Acidobacteriota bacterium]
MSMNRRSFLAGTAALASLTGITFTRANNDSKGAGIKLGVASYSLRKFPRAKAIAMIKELGTPYLNIKEFHLPYSSTPEELAAGRKEFLDAGLKIVGGGTITLNKDDDADMRKYFEYARACGMPLMVIAPTHQTLPRIEKFVKTYDIKVAIHNHGPEDKNFPAPQDVLESVKDMDPRVGLCIDVGHAARTGADVVESIAQAGSRLLDMHMKDLRSFSAKEGQCAVGEGKMPVVGIFKQLMKMNYPGYVNLEYEASADDPLPGMKQSFAYMRGVLAGMKG